LKIEILGTGCAKCNELEAKVKQAVARSGKFVEIEKVADLGRIMGYGVMSTPGLVIDGRVVSTGRVPSVEEILTFITD
jgi:small redox-active disulfide protein 2